MMGRAGTRFSKVNIVRRRLPMSRGNELSVVGACGRGSGT
jgi:hypothetical protein